jgi:riboflavin synthase
MFTGLIQTVCRVGSVERTAAGMKLAVDISELAEQINEGDSVAVNGLCLTAVSIAGPRVCFDVSGESLQKSNVASYRAGTPVNIELALQAGQRFGGHFVQGHVDGTAEISEISEQGDFYTVQFNCPSELLEQMVPKGSVAVNGISLTIAELAETGFRVAIIPQTWKRTNLGSAGAGDTVNIETDIIIKTVNRRLETMFAEDNTAAKSRLSAEKLKEWGY